MKSKSTLSILLFYGWICGLLFWGTGCEEEKQKIKPIYQPLTESVYASAIVQPKGLYQVYSSVNGVIEDLRIEEGQLVKKREQLVKIRNQVSQVNVEKAQLNTQLADQNYERQTAILRGIEDEIQAAQLKLKTDSINYVRQKRLWEQNIGSQMEFDTRKLAYELSVNKLLSVTNTYQRTKAEMDNQLATQINLAKNTLKSSRVTNDDFMVRSNITGKVYSLFKNQGESIIVQEPIATIGSADDFVIEMEVDEVDIARLQIGQKVLIKLDAFGQEIFEASISKIYPQKELRTQTFKVESIFKKSPKTLYAGLSGEANIVISEKEKIMTIPLDYLVESGKVITKEGEVKVQTGLRNMESIEIVSGIDTSTYIIKPE